MAPLAECQPTDRLLGWKKQSHTLTPFILRRPGDWLKQAVQDRSCDTREAPPTVLLKPEGTLAQLRTIAQVIINLLQLMADEHL